MIGSLLVNECAKHLRSSQNWSESQCSISPQGRPWPTSGKVYVGLFCTQDSNFDPQYPQECHRVSHSFTVRISRRVYGTSPDRLHKIYLDETESLMVLANTVRQDLLDNRMTIRQTVNTYITNNYSLENKIGLSRTFEWIQTDSELSERDDDWFWSDDKDRKYKNFAGYSVDVGFGEAEGNIISAQ
jgi:hypothetical protein